MRVLVLGAGKMMGAILEGLKNGQDLSQWMIYSPSGKSAKELAQKVGAKYIQTPSEAGIPTHIFVACKPQQLQGLKDTIQETFNGCTFISLLAAVSEEHQKRILNASKLIRVMPNLPVAYCQGVSLISSTLPRSEVDFVIELFSKIGKSLLVSESELEDLTLLTGSGPALFYQFSQDLLSNFSSLSRPEKEELISQVMIGSGVMANSSEQPMSELTKSVTSKGGVTIAVLDEWQKNGFSQIVREGILKGKKRALEITDLLRK